MVVNQHVIVWNHWAISEAPKWPDYDEVYQWKIMISIRLKLSVGGHILFVCSSRFICFMCMSCLPVWMFGHHVPTEVRRGHWISWYWSYGRLWAAMLVLGVKPRSSARISALNCWAISPAPYTVFDHTHLSCSPSNSFQALSVHLPSNVTSSFCN